MDGEDPPSISVFVNVSVALPVSVNVMVSESEPARKVTVTDVVSALVPDRFSSSSTRVIVTCESVPMMYLP